MVRGEQGQAGLEVSFEDLYRHHVERVHRFVVRRARRTDVDDVVSEVFLIAWRRLSDLPRESTAATGWLLRTASNVALNAARSAQRHERLSRRLETVADPEGTEDDERAFHGFASSALTAAFDSLSESDQEILVVVAWDGLNTDELAGFLRCDPGTARTRLSRARARFRAALGEGS